MEQKFIIDHVGALITAVHLSDRNEEAKSRIRKRSIF